MVGEDIGSIGGNSNNSDKDQLNETPIIEYGRESDNSPTNNKEDIKE